MSGRVEMDRTGAADVLVYRADTIAGPCPGEVRVRQVMIGVNFVDIYHRRGLYALPAYPIVPGVEAVGMVEALGAGVTNFSLGDRVAYAGLPVGSYADYRNIDAHRLIKVPDQIGDKAVAGSFLRGLTAHLLLDVVAPVRPGQSVLIHAAAGGLGLILTQWAKRRGAVTLGTVGSEAKADLARALGLEHAILYRQEDFVARVATITGGRGVDLVIDGVGAGNLIGSLACIRSFGMVANIGQTAGAEPLLDVHALTNRFLIRPSVLGYIADEAAYRAAANAWFSILSAGLDVSGGHEYLLAEAAIAHADMEAGRTSGAVRLIAGT